MTIAEDIIDTDSHVLEPPDLWTSRMEEDRLTRARCPIVEWDLRNDEDCQFIGSRRVTGVADFGADVTKTEHPFGHAS